MRLRADHAIGVFDSGVGGLTVFRALRRALPAERLIYFGDTARLPYGTKTKEAVTRFSLEIGAFLCERDVKMLVVACNTASALALPALKARLPVPVVGVIAPAVRAAAALSESRVVGVIGTEATVASKAYQSALRRAAPDVRVTSAACPLLVPLVEEGWWDHPVTVQVAREYLAGLARTRMDTLILGCTHYPLIKPLVQRLVGSRVRLVDSGEEAARDVMGWLEAEGLRRMEGRGGQEFFVTDGPDRLKRLASRILGGKAPPVKVVRF